MESDVQNESRNVLILVNSRSGVPRSSAQLLRSLRDEWRVDGYEVAIEDSESIGDGTEKALRAVGEGADSIIVVGGDGMVNSIGSVLVGTNTALGVIPAGSGNGFARHFNIPLKLESAVRDLRHAKRRRIDVGLANETPFFVTCSMAWDAAIVKTFEKSPVRGVFPYVFAAVYEFFEYKRQPFEVRVDDREEVHFKDPLVFTVANLTQYGGGAKIAPQASPDDGYLELVVISQGDAPRVLTKLHKLFDGTIDAVDEVTTLRFRKLTVRRAEPAPIQMDGELIEAGPEIVIEVKPRALTVLVPE